MKWAGSNEPAHGFYGFILFRAYNTAVPPTAYFPGQEAGRYHQWRDQADMEPA